MSVPDVRQSISSSSVPRPRPGGSVPGVEVEPPAPREVEAEPATLSEPVARHPWPEPWAPARRGARPPTEYWDLATASWRTRGPQPRQGG